MKKAHTLISTNGAAYRKKGWLCIQIWGAPRDRGRAYGYYCAEDFAEIQRMLVFSIMESYGREWYDYFVPEIAADFKQLTKTKYPEYYAEMEGIVEGLALGGVRTTFDEILAWNFYCSLPYWYSWKTGGEKSDSHVGKEGGGSDGGRGWHGHGGRGTNHGSGAADSCSAFIACGADWTRNGEIVVAHNSFTSFLDGQFSNVVLTLQPEPNHGHSFTMQCSPCWIWSGTDFYISSAGIVCTETTIGGFNAYEKRIPVGYRIRTAVQYGNTLDDYVRLLLRGNSGDYANSWLLGDVRRGEIMRLELGLKYHDVQRTRNGYFIGFNSVYDERIRNLEVVNSGFYDIRRHQGARLVRLTQLMEQYKGRLNLETARRIIADHYDVYLKKANHPCSRTVCSHYDLDAREYMSQSDRPKPYQPHGAVDGIVADAALIRRLAFQGRFGNSCGRAFRADAYCRKHVQFQKFCPYLRDRPSQPWTLLGATTKEKDAFVQTIRTRCRRTKRRRHTVRLKAPSVRPSGSLKGRAKARPFFQGFKPR